MKIAVDVSQIAFPGTGVATYTRNLTQNLSVIDRDNTYEFVASSFRQRKVFAEFAKKVPGQWLILPFPPTALEIAINVFRLPVFDWVLGKVDVFHSSDWVQPNVRAKKVTTVHDLVVYRYPEFSHPRIIAVQKRRMERVKSLCDLIIADSLSTKEDLERILRIPAKKIKVVHLSCGDNYLAFAQKKVSEKLHLASELREKYQLSRPYILAVGTREPRKNLSRLIEAFGRAGITGVDLLIAGRYGWGKENKEKLPVNVRVLGYVPQEDLPILYSEALCFAYPSLYEGFGVPILEAMVSGCPVLTSNVSSMPEVGGDAAIYANPRDVLEIADRLKQIARFRPADRTRWVEAGKKQAAKFSWERVARETLAIYEKL